MNMNMSPDALEQTLKSYIRDIPNFPQEGILFRDITPLLQNAGALRMTINALLAPYAAEKPDYIVGIESRGFLFGIPMAYELGIGFIPIRKKGKLPAETIGEDYTLEYAVNSIEAHKDSVKPGQKVVIVDDLLATGGTAGASISLMRRLGADIIGLSFVIELMALRGRDKLSDIPVHCLLKY